MSESNNHPPIIPGISDLKSEIKRLKKLLAACENRIQRQRIVMCKQQTEIDRLKGAK